MPARSSAAAPGEPDHCHAAHLLAIANPSGTSVACPCCDRPVGYEVPPAVAECFDCRQDCDWPGQCCGTDRPA